MSKRKVGDKPIATRAGSYFASLTVRNIRCFGDEPQTLSLVHHSGHLSQWTILLGENGTGKTTLLQLLAGFELIADETGPDRSDMGVIRAFSLPHIHRLPQFARTPTTASTVVEIALAVELGSYLSREHIKKKAWTNNQPAAHATDPPRLHETPTCHGYGAARRLGAHLLNEADDRSASLFDQNQTLRDAESWLLRLDYSAHLVSASAKARQRDRLERVKLLLIDILPDVEGLRFQTTAGIYPTPRVEFDTPYGWVPLRALGFGYQTTIAWVVDLASRMMEQHPDSPDPLAEPAVVLVDEIDLHLHPRWQRELIRKLPERFPNTQFIATAHSPLIVQAAAEVGANLAVLRREGDHVVIDNDVDQIRGWTVDQILTSNLFGLATARPPALEPKIARRSAILSKPNFTAKDKAEVERLESEIGVLPGGPTFDDAKRMLDIIEESNRLASKYLEREP